MNSTLVCEAILGGLLIGIGLSGMLIGLGRISGASGVVAGMLDGRRAELPWRLMFLAGMVASGLVAWIVSPAVFDAEAPRSLPLLAFAGVLVGTGCRLGNGCTSGHGVCGISRLSLRSIIATMVFMATGVATAVACTQMGWAT